MYQSSLFILVISISVISSASSLSTIVHSPTTLHITNRDFKVSQNTATSATSITVILPRPFRRYSALWEGWTGWCSFTVTTARRPPKEPDSQHTRVIPLKILQTIASYSDHQTLIALMSVPQGAYEAAGRLLYRKIRITKENSTMVFMGMARTHPALRPYRSKKPLDMSKIKDENESGQRRDIIWPRRKVESEDEVEDDPTVKTSFMTHTYTTDYPTLRSHERKRTLLSQVRHLTIGSIPNRFVIEDMSTWSFALSSVIRLHRRKRIFSKVKTLVLESHPILEMYDWYN
ncbi:hypothetical protein L486_00138 [Kwoniella mangroviensis CBS 10435]|uniref:F-box domain-containing protein n=1 Tax=Kwoniella mangroviensis CBS 10435 TaxID=1331196 RepID=A0A1B9IY93_9TREE|nr:hypothetical protein L486_00138 [Kwoniella mangroviensis CBS 10435]